MGIKFKNVTKSDLKSPILAEVFIEGGVVKAGATVEIRDDLAYVARSIRNDEGPVLVEVEPGKVDEVEAQKAAAAAVGRA